MFEQRHLIAAGVTRDPHDVEISTKMIWEVGTNEIRQDDQFDLVTLLLKMRAKMKILTIKNKKKILDVNKTFEPLMWQLNGNVIS